MDKPTRENYYCKDSDYISIWRPDEDSPTYDRPHWPRDCNEDAAAQKLYREVSGSVVQIETKVNFLMSYFSTGFFVGSGDEIVTNSHVAATAGQEPLHITATDGKEYTALIEAADVAADVAVLKVQGLAPDTYKPLRFRSSESMKPGEPIFFLGHPFGKSSVVISPGKFQARGPMINFVSDSYIHRTLDPLLNSRNLYERAQWRAELNSPVLGSNAHAPRGSSGSPALDSDGLVVGVASEEVTEPSALGARSLMVPSEIALNLLNPANRQRKFEYRDETNFWRHPIDYLTGHQRLVDDPVRYLIW